MDGVAKYVIGIISTYLLTYLTNKWGEGEGEGGTGTGTVSIGVSKVSTMWWWLI